MNDTTHDHSTTHALSRRRLLRSGAGIIGAAALAALASACGADTSGGSGSGGSSSGGAATARPATTGAATTSSAPGATTGTTTGAATSAPAATTGGTMGTTTGAATTSSAPAATTAMTTSAAPMGDAGSLVFLSTQLNTVDQAEKMRKMILTNFKGKVDFLPDDSARSTTASAQRRSEQSHVSIIGGLHGDMVPFGQARLLQDLTPILNRFKDRGFPQNFLDLARLGTPDKIYYIPWMQANYIMARTKRRCNTCHRARK